jgi:hypothetical protein
MSGRVYMLSFDAQGVCVIIMFFLIVSLIVVYSFTASLRRVNMLHKAICLIEYLTVVNTVVLLMEPRFKVGQPNQEIPTRCGKSNVVLAPKVTNLAVDALMWVFSCQKLLFITTCFQVGACGKGGIGEAFLYSYVPEYATLAIILHKL